MVRVGGVFDHLGDAQTDAVVQVTSVVNRSDGSAVDDITVPINLAYAADWETRLDANGNRVFDTDGNYEGFVPDDNGLVEQSIYYATVVVTSSGGLVRTFREELWIVAGEA